MTESPDAEDFQAEIIRRYDAPMYRAMLEVYGDQIHPGFLEGDDDDIRAANQVREYLARSRLLQVQRDRVLAAQAIQSGRRYVIRRRSAERDAVASDERRVFTAVIGRGGVLDLDDACAEARQ